MCRLIETLRIKNSEICHLKWHNLRFNRSRAALFKIDRAIDLKDCIEIPGHLRDALLKCRITYSDTIEKIELEPYRLRPVSSLKIVYTSDIDYSFKYADRTELRQLSEKAADCDEILICRGGRITDTTIHNVALYRNGLWYTPEKPLLAGTTRERLLSQGLLKKADICIDDLKSYEKISLINCFSDLSETVVSTAAVY